jgi:G protein-coupled receptor Mth (Methuselah protein)
VQSNKNKWRAESSVGRLIPHEKHNDAMRLLYLVIFVNFGSSSCQKIGCEYKDTIGISGGSRDDRGNYIHKGDTYKSGDFAEFKYKIVNLTHKVLVDPHIRGCVCKLKTCIRYCCIATTNCEKPKKLTLPYDGGEMSINFEVTRNYGVLVGRPCRHLYKLDADLYQEDDEWTFLSVRFLT